LAGRDKSLWRNGEEREDIGAGKIRVWRSKKILYHHIAFREMTKKKNKQTKKKD